MAAKRGKTQAKRNGGGSSGLPGWAWLVIGLVLGVGAFLIAPKFLGGDGKDGFFRPHPNADAEPPALDASGGDKEAIAADDNSQGNDDARPSRKPADDSADKPQSKEPDYDFYTLLPGKETPISDAELAARERAEARAEKAAAAKAAEKAPAAIDATDAGDRSDDDHADSNRAEHDRDHDRDHRTESKPNVSTAAADEQTTAPRNDDEARYILQAGAFGASGDAEALKAKIAFLGLSARVESAQIKGATVYRVRMGPYGSATELADAKRKLSNGGLPAMAVKAK